MEIIAPWIIAAGSAEAGGPGWTDILTAIGTVATAVVAVGIALWTERRSERRLREERAQGKAALEEERAYGRAQIEEERRLTLEREQLAQAHAVHVVFSHSFSYLGAGKAGADSDARRLLVFVMNRGLFTITQVEAQFCIGGNCMINHHKYQRRSGTTLIPEALGKGAVAERPDIHMSGVLTPFDEGILFETDKMHEKHITGAYPVLRWTDQWGTRWEHKHGVVKRVKDDEPWEP